MFDVDRFLSGQDESSVSPCGGCSIKTSSSVCGKCGVTPSAGSSADTGAPAVHLDESQTRSSTANRSRNIWDRLNQKKYSRRDALKMMGGGFMAAGTVLNQLNPFNWMSSAESSEKEELRKIRWNEYFKENYRLMTEGEKKATIERLERRYEIERRGNIDISTTGAEKGVLFGYAFNLSKCRGYRDCVGACVRENNTDRDTNTQYIRIFEKKAGTLGVEDGEPRFFHRVPAEGHFYMGTQCFQCENPPCVRVCPVGATWKEPDGIVVVDYNWCIGCRYCLAACPYWARRFNWKEPTVPDDQVNPDQHYLGNRIRPKGSMEKCTYCIQRSREGKLPACVEACPTGARTFGNLLDPNSEIRWIIENKKVFRLKESLNTEPKFWYYMDEGLVDPTK